MFDTLLRLFDGGNGPLTVAMLANAVTRSWITEVQEQEILASKN